MGLDTYEEGNAVCGQTPDGIIFLLTLIFFQSSPRYPPLHGAHWALTYLELTDQYCSRYCVVQKAFRGELQFVSAEICAAGRFEVFLEFTADQPAENKDDTIGVGRRIVPIAVLRRNQPQRGDVFFHGSAGLLYLPANLVMKFFLQMEQNYSF